MSMKLRMSKCQLLCKRKCVCSFCFPLQESFMCKRVFQIAWLANPIPWLPCNLPPSLKLMFQHSARIVKVTPGTFWNTKWYELHGIHEWKLKYVVFWYGKSCLTHCHAWKSLHSAPTWHCVGTQPPSFAIPRPIHRYMKEGETKTSRNRVTPSQKTRTKQQKHHKTTKDPTQATQTTPKA